jgi:hypothetical protein
MSFASDLAAFNAKQKRLTRALFVNTVAAADDSIRNGSVITGAPGQIVGQYGPGYHPGEVGGTLKASWQTVFESATQATIGTNLIYARQMEEGTRAGRELRQRSAVGGFHSAEKTIQGFDKLLESEAKKLGAT